MKRSGKVLLWIIGVVIVVLLVGVQFTIGWAPFFGAKMRPTTSEKFEITPERIAHGRDIVHLAGCEECHTPRDWTKHGAPPVPGMEAAGQELPLPGLPGHVVAPNLTPDVATGAGSWTDDEMARSIREGITHDGHAMFPLMPYSEYRAMSDEDVASVVVYFRSLPAVHNSLPRTKINFPVNYLIRSSPQPLTTAVVAPNSSNLVERGRYLAKIGCGCHTPTDNGTPLRGLEFAGGEVLDGPWGNVASANITPDATGVRYYDNEDAFLAAVRTGYVGARSLSSIMPYGDFQYVPEEDLKAIFAFLKTVQPVRHIVDNSLPPTYCKICRHKHGGGDKN